MPVPTLHTIMDVHSFHSWLQQRDREQRQHIPAADKVVPLVAQAGAGGMTRSKIGGVIDLERDTLSALLDSLVRFGLLTVSQENGIQVYRVGASPSI